MRDWDTPAALLLVCAVLGWSSPAKAHEAHTGMVYDWACCGNHDCRPVGVDDLSEQPDGSWKYLPTGLIFPPDTVRPSRDRHFHVCIRPHDGKPLCVYILQGS